MVCPDHELIEHMFNRHTKSMNDCPFDLCAGDCHLELIAYRTFEVGFMSEVVSNASVLSEDSSTVRRTIASLLTLKA